MAVRDLFFSSEALRTSLTATSNCSGVFCDLHDFGYGVSWAA
jgi:hypothetical protein